MADTYLDAIADLIRAEADAAGLWLGDAAREFLHRNSIHADGDWWAQFGDDYDKIAQEIYKTSIGDPTAEMAELLCGNMVNFFSGVAGALGIQTRQIWLYADSNDFFQGHTFVELLNPVTGRWEIQDADYNVTYVDLVTGERASVIDMTSAAGVERFTPINSYNAGWRDTGAEALRLSGFFAASLDVANHVLHTRSAGLSDSLLQSIASLHLPASFDYTVSDYPTDPSYRHLTDADGFFVDGRLQIFGGFEGDFISHDGAEAGELQGGDGNDIIAARWGASDLVGGAGDDILVGSAYGDVLWGGAGADYLEGGYDPDSFIFSQSAGFGDTIADFSIGFDKLYFTGVMGLGGEGDVQLSEQLLSYRVEQSVNADGVYIRYDTSGDGTMDGGVLLKGFSAPLAASDFLWRFVVDPLAGFLTTAEATTSSYSYGEKIYGGGEDDKIVYTGIIGAELAGSATGFSSGNDIILSQSAASCALYGHDGDDTLIGGAGHDLIKGGSGNDWLKGGTGADLFVFSQSAGQDHIEDFVAGEDHIALYRVKGQEPVVTQSIVDGLLTYTFDLDGDGFADGSFSLSQGTVPLTNADILLF